MLKKSQSGYGSTAQKGKKSQSGSGSTTLVFGPPPPLADLGIPERSQNVYIFWLKISINYIKYRYHTLTLYTITKGHYLTVEKICLILELHDVITKECRQLTCYNLLLKFRNMKLKILLENIFF